VILRLSDFPAATNSNVQRDRVTDLAASVLPVPSGYWSIFALLSADNPGPAAHRSVSWMRRNIVPAIAGSLADAHNATLPPPDADIDEALRQALARLDSDIDARTGDLPWARQAGGPASSSSPSSPSTLLAFFDSESRVLRVANAGAGRAFLGRRVGSAGHHECRELARSGAPWYLVKADVQSRAQNVEELVGADVFPSRGSLDAAFVEVESVEVRDGDFLVLGSHSTCVYLAGDEAVQAVSGWMREQGESPPERLARDGRRPQDPFFDFPQKDDPGLGLSWMHTVIPDLIRDIDKMFVGAQENAAGRVLRSTKFDRHVEGSACDRDPHASVKPRFLTSSSE
jgi:hypothetical protein